MRRSFSPRVRYLVISALVLFVLLCGVLAILAANWPFTRSRVTQTFEHVLRSNVSIGEFRQCYWPQPGYDAKLIKITRGSGKPLAMVGSMSARSSWPLMLSFTHRVKQIQLSGVRIDVPQHLPPPSEPPEHSAIKTTVTYLRADGTLLSIARPGRSIELKFSRLALSDVAQNKPISFDAAIALSAPLAKISTKGFFGPLQTANEDITQGSGSFALERLNLSQYHLLAGEVSSAGSFHGTLGKMSVKGTVHISQFGVASTGHHQDLTGQFDTAVNGLSGDVNLLQTTVTFLHTTLSAAGKIFTGEVRRGKTVSLDVHSDQARIEDLLHMFSKSPRPAVVGPMTFRCHIILPPGNPEFLKRVQLKGKYRIDEERFTNEVTEDKVSKLSQRSQGRHHYNNEDPVNSEMASDVDLKDGVAHLPNALFAVPGATVEMNGTYDLIDSFVDLRGKLAMKATLSKAVGGFKSILLLPLDPIYKKAKAGTVIPLRITGNYPNPRIRVSLKP